jgi:hypothetical protein
MQQAVFVWTRDENGAGVVRWPRAAIDRLMSACSPSSGYWRAPSRFRASRSRHFALVVEQDHAIAEAVRLFELRRQPRLARRKQEPGSGEEDAGQAAPLLPRRLACRGHDR